MALTQTEKNELLNAIKAESQSVDELTEVTSLHGLTSLPALRGTEVVRAPLGLLSGKADAAAVLANSAAERARQAAEAAKTAAQLALESIPDPISRSQYDAIAEAGAIDPAESYYVYED